MNISRIEELLKQAIKEKNTDHEKINFHEVLDLLIKSEKSYSHSEKSRIKTMNNLQNLEIYQPFQSLRINSEPQAQINDLDNSSKPTLEEIKARIKDGFYQNPDIIKQVAGKIIDHSMD